MTALQRRSGIAFWRQIADEIRKAIPLGLAADDGRIPGETALAERFGVNRHTVRAALAALARERVVEIRHGKGTFAVRRKRIAYPIGRRTRFSAAMREQGATASTVVTGSAFEPAGDAQAARLSLAAGAQLLRLDTLAMAGDEPISLARHWFDAARFADLADRVAQTRSITQALKACGVDDYVRKETIIEAHHAGDNDLERLGLSAGAIVLVTHAVNADLAGRPIQLSETRFAADRISLVVGDPET